MTLLSNFITFPEATTFPAGPYDLNGLMVTENEDLSFQIILKLGFVFDIYHLILRTTPTTWELWHEDSAVMHVDAARVADCPVFYCKPYETECNFAIRVHPASAEKKFYGEYKSTVINSGFQYYLSLLRENLHY